MRAIFIGALLLLAGCTAQGPTESGLPTDASSATGPVRDSWTFDGEFAAGGVGEPIAYTFDVRNGSEEIEALLTWTIPGGALDFQLFDPTGGEVADGWAENGNRRYVTTTYPVIPGTWAAIVSAQQGADIHFSLAIEARPIENYGPLSGTFEVPPANAARGTEASPAWTLAFGRDFGEVNFNMVPGDWFNFTWDADSEVYFNVHFHNDGTTDRPVEYTGTSLDGSFVAPANEVYSLLWRNTGTEAVTITYELDGQYRLHSISRDV